MSHKVEGWIITLVGVVGMFGQLITKDTDYLVFILCGIIAAFGLRILAPTQH